MKENRILFIVILLCIHINTIAQTPVTYNVGQKSVDFSYSHTQNTTQTNNSYVGQASNDVWYEFTLTESFEIDIAASSSMPGIYIYLLKKDTKALIKSSSGKAPEIHSGPLIPGSYYVVAEGLSFYNGSITTKITGKKLTPVKYNVGAKSGYFEYTHTQNTTYTNNCYGPEPGNDVWYEFTLLKELEVEFSVTTKLSGCKVTLLDDSRKSIKSQFGATFTVKAGKLAPGKYYVVSEGLSSNNGEITTTIKGYPLEPVVYGLGSKSVDFSYTHTQDTRQTNNSYIGYAANDVFYQFTLTAEMDLEISASTKLPSCCIYLLNSSKDLLKTERGLSPSIKAEKLAKGTYYVVTEGTSSYNGEFTTTIKGKLSNPVTYNVGTKSTDFSYSHTQNTTLTSNHYVGQESNDVWYEFTLTEPFEIDIATSSSMPGTYVYLLKKDTKELIKSSSGKAPEIHPGTLSAGSYYVVSEGTSFYNGSITTKITGKRMIPVKYNVGSKSAYFEYTHTQNTTETNNSYVGQSSNDVWYEFTLSKELRIEAYATNKTSSSFYLYLLDSSQKQLKRSVGSVPSINESKLAPGKYYIVLEGANGNNGEVTTTLKGYPLEPVVHVVGTKSVDFSYTHMQNTVQTNNSYVGNSSNDVSYQLQLLEEMNLEISATTQLPSCCIYLLNSSKTLLKTDKGLSPTIKAEKLAKGTYYIVAEGNNGYNGEITTSIKGKLPNPVTHIVGTKSTKFTYTHTQDTKSTGNHYVGQPARDVFYQFTLTKDMEIDVSATTQLPGCYIYLLNSSLNLLNSANGYTPSFAAGRLAPGTYYVVSEGTSDYYGIITTTIKGDDSSLSLDFKEADQTLNYVRTLTPQISATTTGTLNTGNCFESFQYYDGLGRPYQTVESGIAPNGNNLVTLQEYDDYGRESRTWLPVPIGSAKAYPANNIPGMADTFYEDPNAYSEIFYENSPLNKVSQSIGPGSMWHTAGIGVKKEYMINTTSGDLAVTYYSDNGGDKPVTNGNYAKGELFVEKITNEAGNVVYTFTNKLGNVVLERQMNGNDQLNTYYVYDHFGNLRFVIPPMGYDLYGYSYKYDNRNRCIEKKIAANAPIYYAYDKVDRLIFSQDGNQRNKSIWTMHKYDQLGRIIYTAEIIRGATHQQMIDLCKDKVVTEVFSTATQSKPMGTSGYSCNFFNEYSPQLLNVIYYDNYDFLDLLTSTEKSHLSYESVSGYSSRHSNVKGLQTGSRTYMLNVMSGYIATAIYYDIKANQVQVHSTNHLPGGYEKNYYKVSFLGLIEQHRKKHGATGKEEILENYSYVYDHAGRVTQVNHQVNNGAKITISENKYDAIGRLISKEMYNNREKINYNYNVRGWLSDTESKNFIQSLHYDYDGNINTMSWQTGNEDFKRTYNFEYDGVNRLKNATYSELNGNLIETNGYTTIYKYDKMGNITHLSRYGAYQLTSGGRALKGLIDDLEMSYTGNKLTDVKETAPYDPVYNGVMHFPPYKYSNKRFDYDNNGNMTEDLSKDIESISYNNLNLPNSIAFSGIPQRHIEYMYDASGVKRQVGYYQGSGAANAPPVATVGEQANGVAPMKDTPLAAVSAAMSGENIPIEAFSMNSVPSGVSLIKKTDYCGNVIYKDGQLDKILIPGGYVTKNSSGALSYTYYLKDHQGNNRVVLDQTGSIQQVNHYYPFGALMGVSSDNNGQTYKFGEKELDRMFGLDLYDFEARMMNSVLGRFISVDPLAEKYYSVSPYAYCMNNPIRFIDTDGRKVKVTNNTEQAIENLAKIAATSLGNEVLSHLIGQDDTYKVTGKFFSSSSTYNVSSRRIRYVENPWYDEVPTDGGSLTPLTSMGHEMMHAYDHSLNWNNSFRSNGVIPGARSSLEGRAVSFTNYLRNAYSLLPFRNQYGTFKENFNQFASTQQEKISDFTNLGQNADANRTGFSYTKTLTEMEFDPLNPAGKVKSTSKKTYYIIMMNNDGIITFNIYGDEEEYKSAFGE